MQPLVYALTYKDGPWFVRVDSRHLPDGARHVHLSRSGLSGEYSWNIDGSRHDEHRFPASEKHIRAAKRVASAHLAVPQRLLQCVSTHQIGEPFTVSVSVPLSSGDHHSEAEVHVAFREGGDAVVATVHAVTAPPRDLMVLVVIVEYEE